MNTQPLQPSRKICFLDLEDTVIDEFGKGFDAMVVNRARVRKFLRDERPNENRIFSFAIGNEHDCDMYRKVFHRRLELELGVSIAADAGSLFKTEDLRDLCFRPNAQHTTSLFFENDRECIGVYGKDYGFIKFVQLHPEFADVECVLLDDAVEEMRVEFPRLGVVVRTVNVTRLPALPGDGPLPMELSL